MANLLNRGGGKKLKAMPGLLQLHISQLLVLAVGLALGPALAGARRDGPDMSSLRVVASLDKEPTFVEGLAIGKAGTLLESTGPRGQSKLRILDANTAQPIKEFGLGRNDFGEGVTVW